MTADRGTVATKVGQGLEARPRTVVRNFADYLGSQLFLVVAGLLSAVVTTRTVGPADYGVYATAMSFGVLLGTFTDLGASRLLVRDAGAARESAVARYLRIRLTLMLVVAALGAVIAIATLGVAAKPGLLALGVLFLAGPSVISPLGQIAHDMRGYRVAVQIQAGVTLVATLSVLFVIGWQTPSALVSTTLVGAFASTVYCLRWARTRGYSFSTGSEIARSSWRSVLTLTIATATVMIYYRLDSILVLRLSTTVEAGYYGAAYRLFEQARLVPLSILIPLSPYIAGHIRHAGVIPAAVDEQLRHFATRSSLALGFLCLGAAHPAVDVLFGAAYEKSADLLIVLGLSLFFVVIAFIAGDRTVNAYRERTYLLVAIAGLAFNIAANILLIPRYGASAAAATTVATEALITFLLLTSAAKTSVPGYRRRAVASTAIGAVALVILLTVPNPATLPVSALFLVAGGALAFESAKSFRRVSALDRPREPAAD